MALSRTILLLRAYVANASIATIAFYSSVVATNKNRKLICDGHTVQEINRSPFGQRWHI
jgi:hypothetical protein